MQILDAFGIEWKLLLVQAINFAVVLFVLYRYAYKPVIAMLEERKQKIAEGVAAAKRATEERDEILRSKDGIISAARAEGGAIVDHSRKEATEKERMILHDANEKSSNIILDAQKKAEEERAHILKESEKDIARMAVLAAEKLLRKQSIKA